MKTYLGEEKSLSTSSSTYVLEQVLQVIKVTIVRLESYLNHTKIAVLYTNHTVMVFTLLFVSCVVVDTTSREKQQQQQHHISSTSMQHATYARWNMEHEVRNCSFLKSPERSTISVRVAMFIV